MGGPITKTDTVETVILGAGVAGIAASSYLQERGICAPIYEQSSGYGGLCRSYQKEGFTIDTLAHVSFDRNTTPWLEDLTPHVSLQSAVYNYDRGRWIQHPVQEHLVELPVQERVDIIESFVKERGSKRPENYKEWLINAYGKAFAENYPFRYTQKYWTVPPEQLETKWLQGRMSRISLRTLLRGAMERGYASHYSGTVSYPKEGGFQSFLKGIAQDIRIENNRKAIRIDPKRKQVYFEDGNNTKYDLLISTIPLPELCRIIDDAPDYVKEAAEGLCYTCGVQVFVGIKGETKSPGLWFYIYDEDILPSRVFSGEKASVNNVPKGCASLQAEVYFSSFSPRKLSLEGLEARCIEDMVRMKLFEEKDICFTDVLEVPYANIMFTAEIYQNRKIIHDYLDEIGILYAGRFGEWDYLWTGQSFLSGRKAAEKALSFLQG